MKNLSIITASLAMFLASCGDKTQFSGPSGQNTLQPTTPRISETTSDASSTRNKRLASTAAPQETGRDTGASEDLVVAPNPTFGQGTAAEPLQELGQRPKPYSHQPELPAEVPGNGPPKTSTESSIESSTEIAAEIIMETPASSPTTTPFQAQAQAAIEQSVLSLQQSSNAALNATQAQSLSVGLASMVNTMAAGPLQAPAALAQLVDLIKNIKGLKVKAVAPTAPGAQVSLNLPAKLPVNIPALANAAVLADLAAALGDLGAAAAALDLAGVVAAIQDLIALIVDLIA